MSVVARGTARIRHADTGVVYEILPDELDWQEMAGEEREMGEEVGYLAQVEHPDLGTLEWEVWEYPVGAFNDQDVNVGRHILVDNFSISLGGGSPDPADDADDEDNASAEDVDEDSDEFRARVAELVEWFRERYEDPAERTPFESAEGGYLWTLGGPHDAREVLGDEFPDDEAVLDAAVREIERDGIYEWAPAPGYEHEPDDEDDDAPPGDAGDPPEDEVELVAEPGPELVLGRRLVRVLQSVPPPRPGPRFEPDPAGRIELSGWISDEDAPQPVALTLLPQVREAAQELVDALAGTNAHHQLREEAERYLAAVSRPDLTIEELYARGVRLENTDFALAAEIAAEDSPPLPPGIRAALQSLLHVHAAAVMADPRGRSFVAGAAAYRRPSGETADAQAAAKRFAGAVREAGHIVGPAAREAAVEAAEALGAGPDPERSTQVSAGVLGGLVHAFGAALKFADAGMMGRFTWEALKNTIVVGGVVSVTTAGLNHLFAFLLEQAPNLVALAPVLATEMPWLQRFTDALAGLRRWVDTHRRRA